MSTIAPGNFSSDLLFTTVAKQVLPEVTGVELPLHLFTVEQYGRMAENGLLPEKGVELIEGAILMKDGYDDETRRPFFIGKSVIPGVGEAVESELFEFSVDAYERLVDLGVLTKNDHVELIEGVIIQMSPIGYGHNFALSVLIKALVLMLKDDWCVRAQSTLQLDKTEPEPDLAILRGVPEKYSARHPNEHDVGLLIEISDSSLTKDRKVKGVIYAQYGLPEYWIVNLIEEHVEIYKRNPNQKNQYLPPVLVGKDQVLTVELDGKVYGQIRASKLFLA
jgi:Uma2 family endonuclease